MLRQKGCFTVPILFPGDSITERTRPVFPPRQTRLSTGWSSPISRLMVYPQDDTSQSIHHLSSIQRPAQATVEVCISDDRQML
jgi:hypothetical protein